MTSSAREATARRGADGLLRTALPVVFVATTFAVARFAAGDTHVLADHHVYLAAANALGRHGDPYAANTVAGLEYQYRYPPLLALAFPLVRWISIPLVTLGYAVAIRRRVAASEPAAGALPAQLSPLIVGNLLNGNVQGAVVGVGSLVPTGGALVASLVAVAAWIKLYPALVVVWWLGRRDWRSLRWFAAVFVGLGILQAPWLASFVAYSRAQTSLPSDLSLRALGVPVWLIAVSALAVETYRRARAERGWDLCVVLQVVALPRLLMFNLPLLLMSPTLLAAAYRPVVAHARDPRRFLLLTAVAAVVLMLASMTWCISNGLGPCG